VSQAPTLETFFTDRRFFGITNATPTQRAICRVAEGLPLGPLASDRDVIEALGGEEATATLAPGGFRPRELDLLCAIRSGKSFFIAAHACWSAQIVNLDTLQSGEVPRYSALSVNLRSAEATFNIIAGTVTTKPALRGLLVGDIGADTLLLRHPSGRPVEICVAAGARAGANLISVWLCGVAFEEYSRQASEGTGAIVNYEQQLQAAAGRVVEGGQILSAGSPWAPQGAAYERFGSSFGRPSAERVVIKAAGPKMNPTWWTPARCEALRKSNPSAYVTDVEAGFADPSTSFLTQSEVRAATRTDAALVLPPRTGRGYQFAMDPATRRNAWTLVGIAYYADADAVTRYEVVLAREWVGTSARPLSPRHVLAEIARTIAPYGARAVFTDQHAADFVREMGAQAGLNVIIRTITPGNSPEPATGKPQTPGRAFRGDLYANLKGAFATGAITVPNDPVLLRDLLSIRRRLTANRVTYDLPETSDGRHCDFAAALALGLGEFPTVADLRSSARAVEHSERIAAVGALLSGAVPADRFSHVLAVANGMDPNELAKPVWQRIAEARPKGSGLTEADAAAWSKFISR
jgi:hypothetical protein